MMMILLLAAASVVAERGIRVYAVRAREVLPEEYEEMSYMMLLLHMLGYRPLHSEMVIPPSLLPDMASHIHGI